MLRPCRENPIKIGVSSFRQPPSYQLVVGSIPARQFNRSVTHFFPISILTPLHFCQLVVGSIHTRTTESFAASYFLRSRPLRVDGG